MLSRLPEVEGLKWSVWGAYLLILRTTMALSPCLGYTMSQRVVPRWYRGRCRFLWLGR